MSENTTPDHHLDVQWTEGQSAARNPYPIQGLLSRNVLILLNFVVFPGTPPLIQWARVLSKLVNLLKTTVLLLKTTVLLKACRKPDTSKTVENPVKQWFPRKHQKVVKNSKNGQNGQNGQNVKFLHSQARLFQESVSSDIFKRVLFWVQESGGFCTKGYVGRATVSRRSLVGHCTAPDSMVGRCQRDVQQVGTVGGTRGMVGGGHGRSMVPHRGMGPGDQYSLKLRHFPKIREFPEIMRISRNNENFQIL